MAQPQLLQDNFTRMIQDLPRDQLPEDAAWYMEDFLPNLGLGLTGDYPGRLSRRSGWQYASENIATDSTSATAITGLGYHTRSGKLCSMTQNNKFGFIEPPVAEGGNDYTQVATTGVQSPGTWSELNGKLVIPADDGTTAPKYYDGTTFGNLAGTPPAGTYVTTWKDRIILGGSSALPNRTWFSALDDATTWDTTNGWVNCINDITGYAPLPNALLIFGEDKTVRIRGSIPPPGSDFIVDDPIFHVGCTFPKSIAVNGANAAFCNEEGVWITNGTNQPQDLTAICGVKSAWQRYIAQRPGVLSVGAVVDSVCGGFIGNYYLATIASTLSGGATYPAFLFNLVDRSCVLISNFGANSVSMTPQVGDELYFGLRNAARIIYTSSIFSAGGDKEDEDGTDVTPILYTRYYVDNKSGRKRWKTAYLDYYLRDTGADTATLTVSYDPREYGNEDLGGETSAATLAETTSANPAPRAKIPLRYAARGMSFKIEQSGASAATNIIALLADVHAREAGRVP